MNHTTLLNFIDLLALVLQGLIIIRVLLSWFSPNPQGMIGRFLMEVTDPILMPFQRLIPPMAGLDFSPIVALVVIQVLQTLLHNWLG